ncbi:ketoacyl-ACP synthase III family protein [Embleya sp. NBC_00896]|uniref:ketoacyl-ACP synthase III family protein n=1 Tax=Embleya sp. NBC_00896 TaxID=2975961 RepID=UPI00386B6619|nr:ketoacyl-ACP synthase III family protein [Embleya sp. NBC_00896]
MRVHGDVFIAGVGSYRPDVVTTELAVERSWYDAEEREASGMRSVMVAGDTPGPDLAIRAAEVALRRSGHTPEDFGAVLHTATYHQGPDGWSAPHYVLRYTLDRPITAVQVGPGCLGTLAGLEMAAYRLLGNPEKDAVLLTAGDNFGTPLVDRWRASKLFLLADGGAAAVVSRRAGFARVLACGAVSNPAMEELHRGGEVLFPAGITVGRSLNFGERSAYWREQWAKGVAPPMGHFGDVVAETAERTLAEAGLSMDKVTRVCHSGYNRGALDGIYLDPLGIDADRGTWELTRTLGHAGAADPFIGLEHVWTRGEVGPGDHVLLLCAGPGMETDCAVLEIVASYEEPAKEGR